MKKYLSWKLLSILVITLFLGFFDLSPETQSKILPFGKEYFQKHKIHLGLDLQGGSQLDYRIDLRKVPEADRESIVDGVQTVIEKRVNNLGVAEPNIYRSDLSGESHIIVELAQTAVLTQEDADKYLGEKKALDQLNDDEKKLVSLEKAKATVGKTIQLEFKEQKLDIDPQEKDKVKTTAQAALDKINDGASFEVIGQEEQQGFPGKVAFEKSDYTFESKLPVDIKNAIQTFKPGEYTKNLVEIKGSFVLDPISNQAIQDSAFAIIKLLDIKEEIKDEKSVNTSHILISWTGLETADATVTRTEEEAYELAKDLRAKLLAGEEFGKLALDNSDDKSNNENGGQLDKPVNGDGTYVFDFEEAALKLEKEGISEIIKTQFGYHIIKADDVQIDVKEKQYQYQTIKYSTKQDTWADTGLTGEHFVHADVQMDNFFQPYVSIQFNDEGAKLFEEITGRNVNKPIAIFVGGELISAPNVNKKISGGTAQISGQFTNEEAQGLARDLNTGAIPAPIVLTGEYTIGATLGQEALSKSLWAGFIGMLLVMVFMLVYYRLPGLVANVALLIYGIILVFLIKSELHLAIAILISLVLFGFLVSKIVNSKDSGWEKLLSFILSCVGFFFVAFLLRTGVVLTLAGIAGIIMSIGMAVDANILIFERIKEELKEGKSLKSAIEDGFFRAWSAIRDSNFSTLLICAILFYFGSSMIRGFAFNLAAGVLVSMFTAIIVTKTILYALINKKIAQNISLFGGREKTDRKPIQFIKKTKLWFSISGVLITISVISIFTFGLNLGIDFTGGSLMELKFTEQTSKENITQALNTAAKEINSGDLATISEATTAETTLEDDQKILLETKAPEAVIEKEEPSMLDLETAQIVEAGESNFIIKTKYLTSETHAQLIAKLNEKLPKFTESRFTTIGPVVGSTLLQKAIVALIIALIMIIFYVAFAFRRIPKEISPWRFGTSAIIGVVHDVVIVIGIFAILGQFLHVEIDALFITALLTVIGYSVNDTIVIMDRLREKILHNSTNSFAENTDQALTETLPRSINTSFSTVLVLIAILVGGSSAIFYFVLALTLGITIGAYSSIFVAAPLLVFWKNFKDK